MQADNRPRKPTSSAQLSKLFRSKEYQEMLRKAREDLQRTDAGAAQRLLDWAQSNDSPKRVRARRS